MQKLSAKITFHQKPLYLIGKKLSTPFESSNQDQGFLFKAPYRHDSRKLIVQEDGNRREVNR